MRPPLFVAHGLLLCALATACDADPAGPDAVEEGSFRLAVSGDRTGTFDGIARFGFFNGAWYVILADTSQNAALSLSVLTGRPSVGVVTMDTILTSTTGGGIFGWDTVSYLVYSGELRVLASSDSIVTAAVDVRAAGGIVGGAGAGDTVRVEGSFKALYGPVILSPGRGGAQIPRSSSARATPRR